MPDAVDAPSAWVRRFLRYIPAAGPVLDVAAGVIVTNYLYRPMVPAIVAAVATDGCLLYETFAAGNERFGRPRNPDFLLRPGELLDAVRGRLCVLAYENLEVTEPRPAVVQRIAAMNTLTPFVA